MPIVAQIRFPSEDAAGGVLIPAYQELTNQSAAPARPVGGKVRIFADGAGSVQLLGAGTQPVRRFVTDYGPVTAFPSFALSGDVCTRTDVGTSGTRFTAVPGGVAPQGAWQAEGNLVVCTSTTRPTAVAYPGLLIFETDTSRNYQWTAAGAWAYTGGGAMPTFPLPLDAGQATSYGTGNDFTTCRYGKDAAGIVHFFGLLKTVNSIAAGARSLVVPVGGMPVGYRMAGGGAGSTGDELGVATVSGNYIGRLDVFPDGSVALANNTTVAFAAAAFVPLSAFTYPTG